MAVIKGRGSAEARVGQLEGGQSEEDRHAGWRYFLEKTDLKPGMDPEKATRLGRCVWIAENLDFNRGAPILSLVACEENSFRRAVASSTTSEVR